MKKIVYFVASLVALTSLISCGTNKGEVIQPDSNIPDKPEIKPDEPEVGYQTPSEEYKNTYKEIEDLVLTAGDVYENVTELNFYTFPLDKEYSKVYYCSFVSIDSSLYGVCTYEENDEPIKELMIGFPKIDKYLKDVRIFTLKTKELGENTILGNLDPMTYVGGEKQLNFNENEKPLDESIKSDAKGLINYLLDSIKQYTAYNLAALGFEAY